MVMFDDVNGACAAAKRLWQTHALKLSIAREIVTIAAGYGDNHDLEQVIGRPDAPWTPAKPATTLVVFLRTVAPDLDSDEVMTVITPATIMDAGSLADHHPLTRGCEDFVRGADFFLGDSSRCGSTRTASAWRFRAE